LQPIGGEPGELEQLSAAFLAGAEQFRTAHSKVKSIHDSVFPDWAGAASREGERVTSMAVGRAQYALDALHNTGVALNVFQARLAADINAQQAAALQINLLLPQYSAQPTNSTLEQEIQTHITRSLSAQQDAVAARRTVEAALVHSSTVQWYKPAGLDPIDAAIIDSLVAHRKMTAGNAQLIAGRLGKLSKKDRQTFGRLEATATNDKQRATLYNELAKGKLSMSQIAASVGAPHAPAHSNHNPIAVTAGGGVAAASGGASMVGAAIAPAAFSRPSGSESGSKTPSKPVPKSGSKSYANFGPPVVNRSVASKNAAFGPSPTSPNPLMSPAPAPVHHAAPVQPVAPAAPKSPAFNAKLPDYSNPASWPAPAQPAASATVQHSAPTQPSAAAQKSLAAKNAAFGPMP